MMLHPASLGVGDGSKHGASAAVLGGDDIGALWSGSWQVPRPRIVERATLNAQGEIVLGEFVLEPETSGC